PCDAYLCPNRIFDSILLARPPPADAGDLAPPRMGNHRWIQPELHQSVHGTMGLCQPRGDVPVVLPAHSLPGPRCGAPWIVGGLHGRPETSRPPDRYAHDRDPRRDPAHGAIWDG